jgi:hypothetical protein
MVQSVRSLSSYLISDLLQWRNKGVVEDFEKETVKEGAALGRRLVAEVGLVAIAAIALVETIIYTPIAIAEGLCRKRAFCKILESSAFTLGWAVVDMIRHNIFHGGALSTHETGARMQAQGVMGERNIFREEDRSFLLSLKTGYPSDARLDYASKGLIRIQKEGANFLLQHIVKGADEAFTRHFSEKDESIRTYMSAKSIWLYAYGPQRESAISQAFSKSQRDQIEDFRKKESKEDLEAVFQNVEAFEAARKGESELFKTIFEAASKTSQSILFRECWDMAITLSKAQVNSVVDAVDGAKGD